MIWDFVWRLVLAAIFGTIIGLDREYREKEAGFRTHFLVSLGSALMMIVSQYGFSEILTHDGVSLDPSRIAGAGGERYRFHRAGTIIFQPPDRAGTDDGCESVGYGRYRFDRRRRNVVAGLLPQRS